MNYTRNNSLFTKLNINQEISNLMKTIFISLLTFYQKFLSPSLKQILGYNSSCRFYPTCSTYAKNAISQKGVIVGIYLTLARLLKCQPFYNPNRI